MQLDDDLEPPSSAIAIRDITEIPDDVIPSFTVDSGGEDQIVSIHRLLYRLQRRGWSCFTSMLPPVESTE